jgi:phosphoribosyl-ATP pyrophosphohydrolase/phosphoribosyl-AMP cyclohydrolase
MIDVTKLKFGENGLIPTIIQHYKTRKVLMLGYSNEDSIKKTSETGQVHFFSRSRQTLWHKGESSGNFLNVVQVITDCDNDTLLILCDPEGPTCHTGEESCFFNELTAPDRELLDPAMLYTLYDIVTDRKNNPVDGSYTNYLFNSGLDKILKKVGEESAETIIASKNQNKEEIILETSDLIYHLTVLLNLCGVDYSDIYKCLKERHTTKESVRKNKD